MPAEHAPAPIVEKVDQILRGVTLTAEEARQLRELITIRTHHEPGPELITAPSVSAFIEALPNGRLNGFRVGVEHPDQVDEENVPCRLFFSVHVDAVRAGKVLGS